MPYEPEVFLDRIRFYTASSPGRAVATGNVMFVETDYEPRAEATFTIQEGNDFTAFEISLDYALDGDGEDGAASIARQQLEHFTKALAVAAAAQNAGRSR